MKTSDIYEQVTDRIITQLEQGIAPWKSPYFSKVGFPRNFSTGKAYQGINVFLLGSHRFTSPYFLTFIQAKELGGHVRKGERGSLVVKYGTYTKQDEDAPAQNEEEAETRRFLMGYTVFHASQIEGIEFPAPENLPELSLTEKTDRAREIIAGMPKPPVIRYGSAIPCYRPATDSVHMPEPGFFSSEEALFSTLFHELAHSTGHASRLARTSLLENKGIDAEGDTARKVYAEEELVAEMAAAFLNAHAGIMEDEHANSAAYLQSWINALKSKDAKGWVIRAASQAQKAANHILNIQPEVQP
ncbi:zincin-like metallopeptidase domain-containing protein [Prosthecobacter algae]|uniref:Zincin-like metallopeptidase domain-containing protein n=1 Tax=Prosthecobacter algae TaxID=1144682 RepID=A0ABP9NVH3_9BACT